MAEADSFADKDTIEKAELPAKAVIAYPKQVQQCGRHGLSSSSCSNMKIILQTKELPAPPLTPEDSLTDSNGLLSSTSPRTFPFGGRSIASRYSVQEAP